MSEWHWTGAAWGEYEGAKCTLYKSKCPKCKTIWLRQFPRPRQCDDCRTASWRAKVAKLRTKEQEREDFSEYYKHTHEVWSPQHQYFIQFPVQQCPKCTTRPEQHGLEFRCTCGWIGYIRFNPPQWMQIPFPPGEATVVKQYEYYWLTGSKGRRIKPKPSLEDYDKVP